MAANFPALSQIPTAKMAVFLALVCALALAAAYTAEYGFGLLPCALCLWQRVPYAIVVALGFLAYLKPSLVRPMLALSFLAFLAGAGIAAFHVGVEQHWWQGTDSCGLKLDVTDLEKLREQIIAPKPRCDEVAWSLFGISMAGYNFILSLVLAGFSFCALKRK